MSKKLPEYKLIRNRTELEKFARGQGEYDWMAFDTEFVGERRFWTLLCLIQVANPQGYFLIDPLEIDDLSPFLELLTDPGITKLTHAGENDYRIFYEQYGVLPRKVFDTQIAAGMVGYRYPLSFGNLVEGELRLELDKAATVTDWESRPLSPTQIAYALNDVLPLKNLQDSLLGKLDRQGRREWVVEEFQRLEKEEAYLKDPDRTALKSRLMKQLKSRDRLLLLRLLRWRRSEAERKDRSLEMILSKKMIGPVVRALGSRGLKGLKANRRIPDFLEKKYAKVWQEMLDRPATEEERSLLAEIREDEPDDPRREALLELLYQAIRFHCLQTGIAVELAFPRSSLKEVKAKPEMELFGEGWRRQLFGESLMSWFNDADQLDVEFSPSSISLVRIPD